MTLTPEQKAAGWIEWHGGECPIKDDRTVLQAQWSNGAQEQSPDWSNHHYWTIDDCPNIIAYRIIEAHGADAEPARPTPYPNSYDELVFDPDGWSQPFLTGESWPEWLPDEAEWQFGPGGFAWHGRKAFDGEFAIRVRRREPKRETVTGWLCHVPAHVGATRVSYDLIDGKPDLSTLKIAEDAL